MVRDVRLVHALQHRDCAVHKDVGGAKTRVGNVGIDGFIAARAQDVVGCDIAVPAVGKLDHHGVREGGERLDLVFKGTLTFQKLRLSGWILYSLQSTFLVSIFLSSQHRLVKKYLFIFY